jgi:hypothetical protein
MSSVPDEYICPITQVVMVDPVLGSDGRTYERSAITEWLRTHNTSPMTREVMTTAGLTPNYALRSLIHRHNAVPQVTVVAVQPTSQLETDHYYALEVFQKETVGYKPVPVPKVVPRAVVQMSSQVPVQTPLQTSAQRQMKIVCFIIAAVIVLSLLIHFL